MTRFTSDDYGEGYWERAEGSNYVNYGDDPGWHHILNVMADYAPIPEDVNAKPRLLEAACAKGWFVYHARARGWDAEGFDLSEYAISKAPGPVREFVGVHDATETWPFETEAYDVVCAWEFLEHINDFDIPNVLWEMAASLKVGGQLWLKTGIVIPDDHPFAGQEDHDHTHVAIHDRAWWEERLRRQSLGLSHRPDIEAALDKTFADRDWQGRFFVWEKVV